MSKECENHNCDFVTIGNTELEKCPKCGANLRFTRSGLFMEQMRIIKEMRNESIRQLRVRGADVDVRLVKPRYMVFENVPGAFTSNKGEDFQAVLEETAKIADKDAVIPRPESGKWPQAGCIVADGWSIAWRVHDAQYWGVPQRRKRICLIADFNGRSAGDILFELRREAVRGDTEQAVGHSGAERRSEVQLIPESLHGYSEQGEEEGQETAAGVGRGADTAGKCLNSWDVQSKHIQPENGKSEALYSGECRYGGGESYVMQACGDRDNPSISVSKEVAYTIPSNPMSDRGQAVLFDAYQHHGYRENDTCGTLTAEQNQSIRGDTPIVVSQDAYDKYTKGEKSASLKASGGNLGGGSETLVIQ